MAKKKVGSASRTTPLPRGSDPLEDPQQVAIQSEEFKQAVAEFRSLIDAEAMEAAEPLGPGAVYTTLVTIWLLVYQRLQAGTSLSHAVHELLQADADLLPPNRRVQQKTLSRNSGAYSRARKRLPVGVTEQVAEHVFTTLLAGMPPSLPGRRAFLLDGTTLALTPTSSLRDAYPPARNQHGTSSKPLALLVVAHEIESGCAILPEVGRANGPKSQSEQQLALTLMPRLPANSILIADRNFGVFSIAHGAKHVGHDVLTRLTDQRYQSLLKRAKLSADSTASQKVLWKPTSADRLSNPELLAEAKVEVWLHEVQSVEGPLLRLLTTWPCRSEEAAQIYRRRLDVETDIRDVKVALNTEHLPGRSVEMFRKELAASIIAYNLVIQIRRLAAKRAGVPPRRISFTNTWSVVKVVLLSPLHWSSDAWLEKFELALRIASQHKILQRPGRSYPRNAKEKKNQEKLQLPPPPNNPNDTK